jgi:hypothetical protein
MFGARHGNSSAAQIAEGLGVRAIIVGIGGFACRSTDYRYPGLDPDYTFLTTVLLRRSNRRIASRRTSALRIWSILDRDGSNLTLLDLAPTRERPEHRKRSKPSAHRKVVCLGDQGYC